MDYWPFAGVADVTIFSADLKNPKIPESHQLGKLKEKNSKTALQHNPEIKQYYHRRLEQGKNEMSIINVIRNKLLARIFSVVKRGTPYVDTMKYAA